MSPRRRSVRRLEEMCMKLVCKSFASACEQLESAYSKYENKSRTGDTSGDIPTSSAAERQFKSATDQEVKFLAIVASVPGKVLEMALSITIELIVERLRRHRSHPGLCKSVQYLARSNLERLDFKALFSGIRLYGEPNARCKATLSDCISRMTYLTHLNLTSKCDDTVMLVLAKNCHLLQELHVPLSDISDTGLMGLCGISLDQPELMDDSASADETSTSFGCPLLTRLGVTDCQHISHAGVGSCLRNLPRLEALYYGKLVAAIETVAIIDGDYIRGVKRLNITHLDQWSEYYEFEQHPTIVPMLTKVCPKLSSLRIYTSDEGCKHLSQIPNIKRLHLESEDILDTGFRLLIKQYSNLVELQLTFRNLSFSRMMNIADSCPGLEVLEMTGMEIEGSENLRPSSLAWRNLRVLNLKMVSSRHPDTLLRYILDYSYNVEEITLSIVCNTFDSAVLQELIAKNPLSKVTKLVLVVSPNTSLNLSVAKKIVKILPSLKTLGLKRWNITNAETVSFMDEIRSQNYDINLV